MNISSLTGIAQGAVPQILPSQPSKQNGDQGHQAPLEDKELSLPSLKAEKEKELEKKKEKEYSSAIKPEDLVLKPSPTTLEERLNQIISAEEVKDILSMVTRVPLRKEEEHKVDVKR
ncbi:MAG: hypothetical protein SH817_01740 [Leptospira sp.]|nr:hypothetical protein [Leptospira sp.]